MQKMETTYEVIKRIEDNLDFTTFLKKGLMPLSILSKKCYYEFYKKELLINGKMQSLTNTSEEYNVSERTVSRAIKFMEQ